MAIKGSLSRCHDSQFKQQYSKWILRIITALDVNYFRFVHAKRSARFGTESEVAENDAESNF